MTKNTPVIMWFRQDLRLSDNPAFIAAVESGVPVLPVYILDDHNAGQWAMGAASRFWLHHSLAALDGTLRARGQNGLALYHGDARVILPRIIAQTGAQGVYWNRCYEPWRVARDKAIKDSLPAAHSFKGTVLHEPWEMLKADGTPYRVFTPFYKANLARGHVSAPFPAPSVIKIAPSPPDALPLAALSLRPSAVRWDLKIAPYWTIGEQGAQQRLYEFTRADFIDDGIAHYKTGRDRPDQNNVSRLSPHLHFGEISPRQVLYAAGDDAEAFTRQIYWREFSASLLYYNQSLPAQPLLEKFARFPWQDDHDGLRAWQRGRTGYPIVDAGMRALWETGTMHNRVRMIAASFLIKDLLIPWQTGQAWFWDTLCDADLANNAASWQWVAGSGADAAPYFRIFNPVSQGIKFDPAGNYVRRWVPELSALPVPHIHAPWDAPPDVLARAGVRIGDTYPAPIINHAAARNRALELYKQL